MRDSFDALPFSNIPRLTCDPSDDALLYVTTFGGSIWRGPVLPHGDWRFPKTMAKKVRSTAFRRI